MGLSSKVNDALTIRHRGFNGGFVANVAFEKRIGRIIRDRLKVREIASVGQLVVVEDAIPLLEPENMTNEIRADEACAASDKKFHRASP